MTDAPQPSAAQQMVGDFAPGPRPLHRRRPVRRGVEAPAALPRDRSLVTVAALIAGGNAEQLNFHLQYAKDNGVTQEELIEVITHLAFYAGWPKAISAITVAKQIFGAN